MGTTNELGQPVGEPLAAWAGRPAPVGVRLTGRTVVLEPLAAGHAEGLATAYREQPEEHWTYLPGPCPREVSRTSALIGDLLARPDQLPYAVLRDGVAVGMLSLMRAAPEHGVIEIGWVAFGEPLQRTVGSTEAQRLLMGHVFDDLGYRRLEWKCDALNGPSRAAAARLGYTFEGVFRQHVVTRGRNRDTAWFSLLDAGWPAVRARLDAWRPPGHFDAEGRPRRALSEP